MTIDSGYFETDESNEILQQFRKIIEKNTNQTYSDTYLIRWLKSTNYDIQKAEDMFMKNFRLRELYEIDQMLEEYKKPKLAEECEFSTLLGFDKDHCAIIYLSLRNADFKGFMNAFNVIDCGMLGIYWTEYAIKCQEEHAKEKGVDCNDGQITVIFDLEYFTLQAVAYKYIIESGLDLMRLFQECYPGIIHRLIVINAPSYFSALFSIFKPIIKMDMMSRITVCSKESSASTLLEYIDLDVLPAFLGGDRHDENGDPFCSSFVKFGKKIPEAEYWKNMSRLLQPWDEGVTEITVRARSYHNIYVAVDEPKTKLGIEICSNNTFGFQAYFRNNYESKDCDTNNHYNEPISPDDEILSPYAKIHCQLAPWTYPIFCSRAGLYVFQIDNSFNWLASRTILYRIQSLS